MRNNNILQTGVETSASLQHQTSPVYPILVMDRGPDVFHPNVEILTRHDFAVNALADDKVGWSRQVSTVRSPVRCD